MSENVEFNVHLYSPRYRTIDIYIFDLTKSMMVINKGLGKAICTWSEKSNPIWSSPIATRANPLISILENEGIYPPTVFIRAVEYAWLAWRNNELDDTEIQEEFTKLFEWVDNSSKTRPLTEFWKSKF
jgi:hypothetical protein